MPVKFRKVFFFAFISLHFFLLCSFQGAMGKHRFPGHALKTEQCSKHSLCQMARLENLIEVKQQAV